MLHLVMDEAQRQRRKVGVLFIDLEAQYKLGLRFANRKSDSSCKRCRTEPLPFSRAGIEFEEFIEGFSPWFGRGESTACFVGIRTAESLGSRLITVRNKGA